VFVLRPVPQGPRLSPLGSFPVCRGRGLNDTCPKRIGPNLLRFTADTFEGGMWSIKHSICPIPAALRSALEKVNTQRLTSRQACSALPVRGLLCSVHSCTLVHAGGVQRHRMHVGYPCHVSCVGDRHVHGTKSAPGWNLLAWQRLLKHSSEYVYPAMFRLHCHLLWLAIQVSSEHRIP
jgi:hypothetical protein